MGKRQIPTNSVHYSELPKYNSANQRCILNVKGTNGSGKTNLIRQILFGNDNYWFVLDDSGKIVAVYNEHFQILGLGPYEPDIAMGGCDRLKGNKSVMDLITLFWKSDLDIIFEGVIVSTIKTTYQEFCQDLSWLLHNYQPRVVAVGFLDTQIDTCIQRIMHRNNGKEINTTIVRNKYRAIKGHEMYYKAAKVPTIVIPSERQEVSASVKYTLDQLYQIKLGAYSGSIVPNKKYYGRIVRTGLDANQITEQESTHSHA